MPKGTTFIHVQRLPGVGATWCGAYLERLHVPEVWGWCNDVITLPLIFQFDGIALNVKVHLWTASSQPRPRFPIALCLCWQDIKTRLSVTEWGGWVWSEVKIAEWSGSGLLHLKQGFLR